MWGEEVIAILYLVACYGPLSLYAVMLGASKLDSFPLIYYTRKQSLKCRSAPFQERGQLQLESRCSLLYLPTYT